MQNQLITDFLKKYGVQDIHSWNDKEFENASKLLFQETGIRISINTLKRLFGKIKTDKAYKPQSASLNALAKYLGYSSYYEYKKNISIILEDEAQKNLKKAYSVKVVFGLLFMLLISIISALVFYWNKQEASINDTAQKPLLNQEVLLKVNPLSSTDPTQVDFVYEVPEKLFEKGEGKFIMDGKSYPLEKSRTIISKEFSTPGIYRGRIMINGKIYKSQAFSILSNGWIFQNGSKELNDSNRGNNENLKVQSYIIKDFYIPDNNLLVELQYDTIQTTNNLANHLKIKLKLVFDHEEAFFVFYGDDIVHYTPINAISESHFPEQGKNHKIFEGQPLNIQIIGDSDYFNILMNNKQVSQFRKTKEMGDLRMIQYESRRVKVTLNKFSVSTVEDNLSYDLMEE